MTDTADTADAELELEPEGEVPPITLSRGQAIAVFVEWHRRARDEEWPDDPDEPLEDVALRSAEFFFEIALSFAGMTPPEDPPEITGDPEVGIPGHVDEDDLEERTVDEELVELGDEDHVVDVPDDPAVKAAVDAGDFGELAAAEARAELEPDDRELGGEG